MSRDEREVPLFSTMRYESASSATNNVTGCQLDENHDFALRIFKSVVWILSVFCGDSIFQKKNEFYDTLWK